MVRPSFFEKNITSVYHVFRGMTLIEVIVGTFVVLMIFLGIFGVLRLSVELVFSHKAKTGATSILNERLEYVRGLPYERIGTVGGIPDGNIPQTEQVVQNNILYTVRTLVQYVDAPEDGLEADDVNGITTDYKTIKVEVSWSTPSTADTAFAIAHIAPIGQESPEGGGTLRVNVFDNAVAPVSGATVRIVNTTLVPNIDVSSQTNAEGVVSFPGTPMSGGYEIYVDKEGYSSAQTYGVTQQNAYPSPIHVSVVDSKTTTVSFAIDELSFLRFTTYDSVDYTTPRAHVSMNIHGTKTIGSDPDGQPIYTYQDLFTTNAFGEWASPPLEWDKYIVALENPGSFNVVERCPHTITLAPGEVLDVALVLGPNTAHALHVFVVDENALPITNATIEIVGPQSDTKTTSACGQAYFGGVSSGQYSVTISKNGFESYSESFEVNGETEFVVSLIPN